MSRSLYILIAALLAGCATAEPDPGLDRSVTRETLLVTTGGGETQGVILTRERLVTRAGIVAPFRAVWNALPDAYADAALPLPDLDTRRSLAAVQNHRAMFRLGEDRLSRFFDCGTGPTGLNADQRRLRLSVYVAVLPEQDGTTPVEIRAEAMAQSTEGSSAPEVACSSSGLLEQRMARSLQLRALQSRSDR
jgi:hypothetical protein